MPKDGIEYEAPKNITKTNGKTVRLKELERLSTTSILWFVACRHKVGLLSAWAITATALYIFPPLPDLVIGLIK